MSEDWIKKIISELPNPLLRHATRTKLENLISDELTRPVSAGRMSAIAKSLLEEIGGENEEAES